MVVQTVIHQTVNSIRSEAEALLIENADKYMLNKLYKLGDSYCREEQAALTMIHDIIKTDNCELLELIREKLEDIGDEKPTSRVAEVLDQVTREPEFSDYTDIFESNLE